MALHRWRFRPSSTGPGAASRRLRRRRCPWTTPASAATAAAAAAAAAPACCPFVAHAVPVGGEDLDAYAGSARLVRAAGDEPFETSAGGEAVVEHPDAGEVVWRDDLGVTCRRWNWRQTIRTRITTSTSPLRGRRIHLSVQATQN